ncbi:AAA family ATPase [Aeromonas schubertii]|uniref:sigma-54-dependent Fis family transcriptional regulator n=1 Tax=Aeromonas schubertii TaxID=652 RepID=UPI00067F5742|nr:sigma-54-dependent Fis family transcriptional regulator [Aeromonas schubertii]KUE81117.1 AAA family ATPase [Aeromonas schubertii]
MSYPAPSDPIRRSWLRCREMGLQPGNEAELDLLARGELSARLEGGRDLVDCFRRYVLPLFEQLQAGRPCRLLLCDTQGAILDAGGSPLFERQAERVFLQPGACWGEASKGTNAIGTALCEGGEVQVLGGEHFFERHRFLGCSAIPLLGPDGNTVGVLDLSSEAGGHGHDMLGTVRLLAMTLENALLAGRPGRLLDLEPQSPWSARLLLGEDGELLGANRAGRRWLECHPLEQAQARPAGAGRAAPERVAQRMLARGIPLLIEGETGSGKEHLVRELHRTSARAVGPLVCVNCGALPADLVEAELFGYLGGAFSGARSQGSQGYLRAAHGGILMLDEIGELPLSAQTRLLRVLQERAVTPVGGTRPEPVDFWLVSASHRGLKEMVASGQFREDLYYRLCGWHHRIPPLREWSVPARRELIGRLLAEMEPGMGLAPDAEAQLLAHPLPGNVRQLKQVLEVACVLADGAAQIAPCHLTLPVTRERPALTLAEGRRSQAEATLAACGGNLSEAARRLAISRSTLYRLLKC